MGSSPTLTAIGRDSRLLEDSSTFAGHYGASIGFTHPMSTDLIRLKKGMYGEEVVSLGEVHTARLRGFAGNIYCGVEQPGSSSGPYPEGRWFKSILRNQR